MAIMSKAAGNIHVQYFVWTKVCGSLGQIPRIAGFSAFLYISIAMGNQASGSKLSANENIRLEFHIFYFRGFSVHHCLLFMAGEGGFSVRRVR